ARRRHAPLRHPDGLAAERHRAGGMDLLVEPDLLQVDVHDRAAHLVALVLLEDRRVLAAAVDGDVEHRVRAGTGREGGAEITLADADRDRLRASVEDARDEALPAQASRFRRAEPRALGDGQLDTLSGHGPEV